MRVYDKTTSLLAPSEIRMFLKSIKTDIGLFAQIETYFFANFFVILAIVNMRDMSHIFPKFLLKVFVKWTLGEKKLTDCY